MLSSINLLLRTLTSSTQSTRPREPNNSSQAQFSPAPQAIIQLPLSTMDAALPTDQPGSALAGHVHAPPPPTRAPLVRFVVKSSCCHDAAARPDRSTDYCNSLLKVSTVTKAAQSVQVLRISATKFWDRVTAGTLFYRSVWDRPASHADEAEGSFSGATAAGA